MQNPTTIENIPIEINMMIFKELLCNYSDMISVVCLRLACPTLYPVLKAFLPEPICLRSFPKPSLKFPFGYCLGDIIEAFFGSQYRPSLSPHYTYGPLFLKRSVYGDDLGGVKELKLEERYEDYEAMCGALPNPFNMGDDWYIVVRNKFGEQGSSTWPGYVKEWYKSTYAYARRRDENWNSNLVMIIWSEWVEMMGF
jgi:hypothetical protein